MSIDELVSQWRRTMPEVELATQALVAGVTVGLTETVQRGARDAWSRLISLVRRGRNARVGEERSATDPGEGIGPVDGPDRGVPNSKYTVLVHEAKGVLVGDNCRQNNHFH